MTLRKKELEVGVNTNPKQGDLIYYRSFVKRAILHDMDDITNLYKSITKDDSWQDIKEKVRIHIRCKQRRFGDFRY